MKQKAVIIDIDGTLSNSPDAYACRKPTGGVDWLKWMASTADSPVNIWCKELSIAMHKQGYKLIFLTARNTDYNGHTITREWLNKHLHSENIYEYELIMRPANDYREDVEVKEMLYSNFIEHKYDVLFAIDDKLSIIKLWKKLNIQGLHCSDK
jgi:uncharacterized HAD superfamily protein